MTTLMQDTAHEKRVMSSQVEAVGRELTRYGLVVVVEWLGAVGSEGSEAERGDQFRDQLKDLPRSSEEGQLGLHPRIPATRETNPAQMNEGFSCKRF
jgi:hypothetical protein